MEISYGSSPSDPEQVFDDLALLEVQVLASDAEATRLAFRLRSKSDGHLTETLDIMLGRLIRINPRLFLTSLHEQKSPVARLDSMIANFGNAFADRASASRYESERRIAALLTVTSPRLLATRNECVALLKKVGS